MTQTRDQVSDLHAGQLPALAGLGPLRNLDLELFAVIEILRRHPKAPRGHLLDLGRRIVAIGLWHEMRRIFSPFTTVRFCTDAVHGHVQRLVRLRAQSAQRHARCHEPLADRRDAFHLFDGHRAAQRFEIHQVPQVNWRGCLHLCGILLPHLVGAIVAGHLHHVHRAGLPSVRLTRATRLVEAANGQNGGIPLQPALGMHLFGLLLDTRHADTRDPGHHAGEVLGHHRARQAHGLEVEPAPIRRDHRNAHLGHDLEQPRIHRLAVAGHALGQGAIQQAALDAVCKAVLGEIGVYRGRTTADQHCKIMRIDTFGGTHIDRAEGPQAFLRQPTVHGRGGQDHRHADRCARLVLIRQYEMARARAHCVFGLTANPVQRLSQGGRAGSSGECTVDLNQLICAERAAQPRPLGIAKERAVEHDDLGLAAVFIQHILEVAKPRLKRHHPVFAQAVDRGVGHLAEVLTEEMGQRAVHLGKHRRGRVVAHGGDRLFRVFGHGRQDLLDLFDRVPRRNLPAAQFIA